MRSGACCGERRLLLLLRSPCAQEGGVEPCEFREDAPGPERLLVISNQSASGSSSWGKG